MKLPSSMNKIHLIGMIAAGFLILLMIVIVNLSDKEEVRQEKIGLIILGDIKINGWNAAHYNGIKYACEKFGLELMVRDNVRENSGQCPAAIKDLADNGASMIFLASYSYSREVQDLVREYPNIAFATNSAEVHGKNLTSYFVRMYQARYLAGADVLTYHQDEDATAQVADKYGVDFIAYNEILSGYSEHYLTSVASRWDLYYYDIIQRYLKGEMNSVKNYWLGIDIGAVMLSEYSPRVTLEEIRQIDSLKQELINDKLIFSGLIYDNEGNIRCEEGEAISDDTLLENINWLVKGVEVLE